VTHSSVCVTAAKFADISGNKSSKIGNMIFVG
jgi:hypothetical protein